jgi:hypothetical protein
MLHKFLLSICFTCLIVLPNSILAQTKNYTISGKITDAKNGEELIGASVAISELKTGTATNAYGFYSISLPIGSYKVEISYVGYETIIKELILNQNFKLNVELKEAQKALKEVVVNSDKINNNNVTQNKMSVIKIDVKNYYSLCFA